ncbi:MAG: hypothetical protein J5940_07945 [Clostridia bacterium]|nr:hypothetical protein [Clostridia bacterium]
MTASDREKHFESMKSAGDLSSFRALLRAYILERLELPPETKEDGMYNLVLYSVRIKMPGEDVSTLESRLATVDCHQTSYIVSKKTLLMMEIERGLSVEITADEAVYAEDAVKYAEILWRALKNGAERKS